MKYFFCLVIGIIAFITISPLADASSNSKFKLGIIPIECVIDEVQNGVTVNFEMYPDNCGLPPIEYPVPVTSETPANSSNNSSNNTNKSRSFANNSDNQSGEDIIPATNQPNVVEGILQINLGSIFSSIDPYSLKFFEVLLFIIFMITYGLIKLVRLVIYVFM